MLKKVLVLCSGYPSKSNPYNCTWAHTRNRYYVQHGVSVDVLVNEVVQPYSIDGVDVVLRGCAESRLDNGEYDCVLSHSPNIRWHIPFLSKVRSVPIVLFMHGSESMSINHDYPAPYPFQRSSLLNYAIREIYDSLKFRLLKRFILSRKSSIHLVFVSKWMRDMFSKNVFKVDCEGVSNSIINNSLNESFLNETYRPSGDFLADFVTLRPLDNSKYAIDLVVEMAVGNPDKSFHVYGRGRYFSINALPLNLKVFDKHVESSKIPELLNSYRYALMPTRCDAQGVMVCEMAAYGIPVITSDIAISHEMFDGISNVKLLPLTEFGRPFESVGFDFHSGGLAAKKRFDVSNNMKKELELFIDCIRRR